MTYDYIYWAAIGCKYQNVIVLGSYRTHNIHESINPDARQSMTNPV